MLVFLDEGYQYRFGFLEAVVVGFVRKSYREKHPHLHLIFQMKNLYCSYLYNDRIQALQASFFLNQAKTSVQVGMVTKEAISSFKYSEFLFKITHPILL